MIRVTHGSIARVDHLAVSNNTGETLTRCKESNAQTRGNLESALTSQKVSHKDFKLSPDVVQMTDLDHSERSPVSEAALSWLCNFASGDLGRHDSSTTANWQEVFQGICRNGLVGLTHRYFTRRHQRDNGSPDCCPPTFQQQIRTMHYANTIRLELLYRKIMPVLNQLAEAGVDHIVVKGPAVAHTIYPDPFLRSFRDLDLIVREQDWSDAHQVLIGMGFVALDNEPEPPPRLVPQAVPYELKYTHPESGLGVEIHFGDILNMGLESRDLEGFWARARGVAIRGASVKVLCLEDQLVHLCCHLHAHGYTRLNWFSDIAFIIRDHSSDLNWDLVLRVARTEEAQVPVYYSLYYVEKTLGVRVPEAVRAELRPDWFRRLMHEHYMPERLVLSQQPMSRPIFGFYFFPLFERLLPSLLVMGRRREKVHYLLRLLAPAPDWLRYYYRLSNATAVAPHYILHPLKLMYRYGEEAMSIVTRGLKAKAKRFQTPVTPT
jgi:hypothetical protein